MSTVSLIAPSALWLLTGFYLGIGVSLLVAWIIGTANHG